MCRVCVGAAKHAGIGAAVGSDTWGALSFVGVGNKMLERVQPLEPLLCGE